MLPRFTTLLALAASLARLTAADGGNSVNIINQADVAKTVVFTNNDPNNKMPDVTIPALGQATVAFETGWKGNFYSYNEGTARQPGMLAELAFDQGGDVYYDVSAIVNNSDNDGVKLLYPSIMAPFINLQDAASPSFTSKWVSGCAVEQSSSCTNQYNAPNDVRTLTSNTNTFVCLLGLPAANSAAAERIQADPKSGAPSRKRHVHHPRHFVA